MSIYGRIGARALGCAFMLCVWCSAASAFCFAPTAPELPWGGPPRAPNCGPNGCSEWEIDHYRKKVEAYIEALQEYASEAGQFANEAAEYARCQADVAAEKLDKFIGE